MNAQEIIASGILELYCTGLTSAAENAEVEQWARQYPEVAAELEAIQAGLETYARAQAIQPPASVKEKVLTAINAGTQTPVVPIPVLAKNERAPVRPIAAAWKYAAAASIILLAGSLVFNYLYYQRYTDANEKLASVQNELQEQKALAQSMHKDMDVMADMNAMQVSLKTMDSAKHNAARIYWMKNTGEVYLDPSRLPQLPENKQYQFWAIVDGKPVNGGIITTLINGKAVHLQQMKTFGNAEAFAVSIEDAGPEKPAPSLVKAMGSL